MSGMRKYWPLALFALATLLPLWRAVLLGEFIGPFDQLRHFGPWYGPQPARPWDVLQMDGVLQFYPWRDMVFEAWGKGQLPAWNPYELAGTPLLGASQSAAFYPPHILLGFLHVPTGNAMALLAWFHLFWAAAGSFYLARTLGASRLGASVAGLGFALSPFMVAWTVLPSVITTVAWIPWCLTFVVKLYVSAPGLRAQRKRVVALAACIGMMLLGGHLQFAAYGFLAVAILSLWLTFATVRSKSPATSSMRPLMALLGTLAAVVLGAAFAAPQLLPVLKYSAFSHRANQASEAGYQGYVERATRPWALQGFALPTALGNPAKESPIGSGINAYWPALTQLGSDFAESAVSVGPVIFLLLFFVRRLRNASAGLAAMAAIAALLAFGTPLNRFLYFLAPGWSATGSPGRIAVLVVLCLCVLAGLAVDRIEAEEQKPFKLLTVLGALLALVLALFPFLFGPTYSAAYPRPLNDVDTIAKITVKDEMVVLFATLCIATAAMLLAKMNRRYIWALPVACTVSAVVAYGNLVPTSSQTLPPLRGASYARYAVINDQWPLLTAQLGPLPFLPPNTAAYSRIHEVGGYDSLLHRDTAALLRDIDGQDAAPPTNGNMMFVKPRADLAKLAEAGVTEIWSSSILPGYPRPTSMERGWIRYRIAGKGRAFTPSGPATILSEGYDSIELLAIGPGTLTLKDRLMPGWEAYVDGKPTPVRGTLWREVELPPAGHRVLFRYSPPGLSTGIMLAVLSLVAGAALLLLRKPERS
jgi:hypothetical protein